MFGQCLNNILEHYNGLGIGSYINQIVRFLKKYFRYKLIDQTFRRIFFEVECESILFLMYFVQSK